MCKVARKRRWTIISGLPVDSAPLLQARSWWLAASFCVDGFPLPFKIGERGIIEFRGGGRVSEGGIQVCGNVERGRCVS